MPARRVVKKKPKPVAEQQPKQLGWLDKLLGRGKPKDKGAPPAGRPPRRPPTDVIPEP